MRKPALVRLLLIALVTTCVQGCRGAKQTAASHENVRLAELGTSPTPSPESEMSVNELIKQWPSIEKEKRTGMLQAWSRVPNNDNYRVARKADFENPFMLTDYGELAGAYGLAVLIVKETSTSANRMSLIIFVERPGNRSDIYWIYRDMDLSKYRMSRASGDIFIDEIHEDGSKSVCELRWDKKEGTWACRGL